MGILGISFLRSEQIRKNQLVRMEIVSENDETTEKEEKGTKVKDDNG